MDEYKGWIKKGWTMDGPPFRRVDHRWVDDRWTTLWKGGSSKGGRWVGPNYGPKLFQLILPILKEITNEEAKDQIKLLKYF